MIERKSNRRGEKLKSLALWVRRLWPGEYTVLSDFKLNFEVKLSSQIVWRSILIGWPSPSVSNSDNLLVIGWSYKRNKKNMEMFHFSWRGFRRAYDCAQDPNCRFSQARHTSYNCDSTACKKKALDNCKVQKRIHTSNYVGVSVLLFVLRQQGDVWFIVLTTVEFL